MRAIVDRTIQAIDKFSWWTGEAVKWIIALLVLLIFADVLLRYLISQTQTWIIELEWHFFALIFLLGAAYAFREERHVRVDVLFAKWPERRKAWVDLLGTVLFLIPWCLMVIFTSFRYADNALAFHEGSPDPGGLPARYVIKFAITVGFVLLLLQAIARLLRTLQVIFNNRKGPWKS